MKNLLITLVLLSLALTGQAQRIILKDDAFNNAKAKFSPPIIVDKHPVLECIYNFTEIDKELDESRNHVLILQVGQNASYQIDFGNYMRDSVYHAKHYNMTNKEGLDIAGSYRTSTQQTIRRMGNTYWEKDGFIVEYVEYEDSTADFNWKLYDDTLTVCSYPCKKAVGTLRGRTWTVWYTEQIPIDAGPWKFHGLPGLVLKATGADGLHDFEATTVRKPHAKEIRMSKNTILSHVTRQEFRDWMYQVAIDRIKMAEGMGVKFDGGSQRTRDFYSPLELE